jgi:hypothetical protein
MTQRNGLAMVGVLAVAIVALAGASRAQDSQPATGKLKVKVEYTGQSGSVDKEHKLWIWVFDTPNITAESTPLTVAALIENKASYQFIGLPKVVYIAAAFDNRGGYDGNSAPPAPGTPLTIFGGAGGPATAVTTGADDAAVTVTFDDAIRMP